MNQSSTHRIHVPIAIKTTCIFNFTHGNALSPYPSASHFTIDPRQRAWKEQICMRDVIRAVVMVLVDRKSEASMEVWTVGSKLCGGWRGRLRGWMLEAYIISIIIGLRVGFEEWLN
jgi:hypothetical protein